MIYTLVICGLVALLVLGFVIYVLSEIHDGVENQYDEHRGVIDEES